MRTSSSMCSSSVRMPALARAQCSAVDAPACASVCEPESVAQRTQRLTGTTGLRVSGGSRREPADLQGFQQRCHHQTSSQQSTEAVHKSVCNARAPPPRARFTRPVCSAAQTLRTRFQRGIDVSCAICPIQMFGFDAMDKPQEVCITLPGSLHHVVPAPFPGRAGVPSSPRKNTLKPR